MSTHALASLTANYTDSEPEADEEEKNAEEEKGEKSSEDSESRAQSLEPSQSKEPSRQPSPEPIKIPYAKLVSYNDDADLEDDEDGELRSLSPTTGGSVELPPEPTGRISPRTLEKVAKLYERMETGMDMNALIQNRKDFRNPSIYEKLIQYCGINELGTNYLPSVYDPQKWGKESFYGELCKVQKLEMRRREKEKKVKPEFVVGTKKVISEDEAKKRKSKWDQVGSGSGGGGLQRQPGMLQPSLTGTKSTVISAFGSLPKKPKL